MNDELEVLEDNLDGLVKYNNDIMVMVNYGEYMLETGVIKECYANYGEQWYKISPLNLWFRAAHLDSYK